MLFARSTTTGAPGVTQAGVVPPGVRPTRLLLHWGLLSGPPGRRVRSLRRKVPPARGRLT